MADAGCTCAGSVGTGARSGPLPASRWTRLDYALLSKKVAALGMGVMLQIASASFDAEARLWLLQTVQLSRA